jgi:hypothetical protein
MGEASMSRNDRDFRLAKRVTLNAAAIYLPTYKLADDGGNFKAAKTLLDQYNIGLEVWPRGGGKQSVNSLIVSPYDKPIADNKAAYQQLVKDVNDWIKNRATGYPFLVSIIFCEFAASGAAITPHSSKVGAASPACLISMSAMNMKDKMTILHEMGHSALYPVADHDNSEAGNLMQETDGRKFLFRYQVEAFSKAFFARSVATESE